MSLDVTIYSALLAGWYFEWGAPANTYSYRQRPYEYDQNQSFRVLYDDVVNDSGTASKCERREPCPSPGTPRHPASPSGHSTYSAAASELLAYFFPNERQQLERLADNIGMARLWAGIHWRSDHVAGRRIGRAVAKLVIDQLRGDCVPTLQQNAQFYVNPPDHGQLRDRARTRRTQGTCDGQQDVLPPQRRDEFPDCPGFTAPF